jgi:4-hydroxybenzoate polyprenyltransferase
MSLAFSRLRGLARAAHPFPLAAVVTLTALIGIVSAEGATDIRKLALLGVAMLLSQLAIGWTNDYLDRERDAAAQPDKPVPSGEVPAGWLPAASVKALAGSFAAGAALGSEALLLLIGGTLCGLVYNAWLKQTPLSWLPYVLALALLPLYVWTALDVYRNDFLWLYAVAWPLPVAVHVANTLPDIDADAGTGRRGVVVRLGRAKALALLVFCVALPALLFLLTLACLDYETVTFAATLTGYNSLLIAAGAAYRLEPFARGARIAFRLVALAAVVFATGWLATIE